MRMFRSITWTRMSRQALPAAVVAVIAMGSLAHLAFSAERSGLARALLADGPDPKLRDKLLLFDQFVGDWNVEVRNHLPDGSTQPASGVWRSHWILDGRALQTVWTVPDCSQRPMGARMMGCGITIVFYEPKSDTWRGLSASVSRPAFTLFTTRHEGDEIVMADEAARRPQRWIFSQITPRSFRWRALESNDGGASWNLQQEMIGTRLDSATSASRWLLLTPPAAMSESQGLFGQFVGDWAIECEAFLQDGTLIEREGEIHWDWIMNGLALQDVWVKPGTRLGGTTLRLFDRELGAWRSVFVHPSAGIINAFIARQAGAEIVLEKMIPIYPPERWIFSNVSSRSFDWRSIESHDQGETWVTTEHYRGRRVSGSP
jgi:hypothetical protein